jgi:formylglycine-generating enzyme required for sulfatase activity
VRFLRIIAVTGLASLSAAAANLAGVHDAMAQTPPAESAPPGMPAPDAERVWSVIQNTTSLAVLDEYIRQFGNAPVYGALARARREELAKAAAPAVVQPAVPAKAPRAGVPLTTAQERGLKVKDTFRECADCPELVVVPAGSFTMGSPQGEQGRRSDEGPQHVVTLSRPFAVGRFQVTRDQFAAFVHETGYAAGSACAASEGGKAVERAGLSWRSAGFAQDGSHPVVCVTWDEARTYVDWMAKKTGKPYRLLSEAEWEYVARGGGRPRFWFGDDDRDLCRYGNGGTKSLCNDGYDYTAPAGYYPPNAFGLYDMAGNAGQWTADCWHDSYNGAPADGSAWTAGCRENSRVVRGGSWDSAPAGLRAASRTGSAAASNSIGFRVGRMLGP